MRILLSIWSRIYFRKHEFEVKKIDWFGVQSELLHFSVKWHNILLPWKTPTYNTSFICFTTATPFGHSDDIKLSFLAFLSQGDYCYSSSSSMDERLRVWEVRGCIIEFSFFGLSCNVVVVVFLCYFFFTEIHSFNLSLFAAQYESIHAVSLMRLKLVNPTPITNGYYW